jgi:hypothetical protein
MAALTGLKWVLTESRRSENDATHDDFLYVKSSGAYHGKAMSVASPATRRSPPMRRPTIVWSSSRRSLHPVPWYGVNYVCGDCTIGHIARAAGVHIKTVRYYQRRGLDDLVKLRAVLQGLVAACDQPHGSRCPIIEQLEGDFRS